MIQKKFNLWIEQPKDSVEYRAAYLSRMLRGAVLSVVNKQITEAQLSQWMLEFAKLLKKRNAKDVLEVCRWYRMNIGGEYIPVAHSGKAFVSKFYNIEMAMHKENCPMKVKGFVGDREVSCEMYNQMESI